MITNDILITGGSMLELIGTIKAFHVRIGKPSLLKPAS
jgi:orotate phosphoribosyltransferase